MMQLMRRRRWSVKGKNEGEEIGSSRLEPKRLSCVVERAFEIAEGDVGVHGQASIW